MAAQAPSSADEPWGHDQPAPVAAPSPGRWRRALHRLRRDWTAAVSVAVLAVLIGASGLAPLYARYVARTDAFASNLGGTTIVNGQRVDVIQASTGAALGETPIGPTLEPAHYFLGADSQGRDVAARLLYGGEYSLVIGVGAALLTTLLATLIALVSGSLGGWFDSVVSRLMDILWAFPVFLLAILISTVSLTQGLRVGPIEITTSGIWLPLAIITLIYMPYVFRPIRAQVLALREREFVKAAIAIGASQRWLVFSEILPNVLPAVIVFIPLMAAVCILTESGLSFLGIGVQPPEASWGTIVSDGEALLYTRPWVTIAPGLLISITVVSFNLLGDAVRDALDTRVDLRGS